MLFVCLFYFILLSNNEITKERGGISQLNKKREINKRKKRE